MNMKLNPINGSHWQTHAEHESKRDFPKLTKYTNPTLWAMLTAHGAKKPPRTSPVWNDWAANNPQPEAKALAKVDIVAPMMGAMKAIATGARPVNSEGIY